MILRSRHSLLTLSAGITACVALILTTGCSTTKVAADRATIEQSKRIAEFTWRGRPFYDESVGTGAIGAGASIGNTLFSAASGKIRNTIQAIYDSGVYQTFESDLIRDFSSKLSAPVSKLSATNYVYSGAGDARRIDVLASAKAQGYDAVIEATVWPSLFERQPDVTQGVNSEAVLKTDIVLKRCADGKVLWKVSYKNASNSGISSFNKLAQESVATAIKLYSTPK